MKNFDNANIDNKGKEADWMNRRYDVEGLEEELTKMEEN